MFIRNEANLSGPRPKGSGSKRKPTRIAGGVMPTSQMVKETPEWIEPVVATTARENTLIVVVFDRSGSMQENGKIREARHGYNNFINEQKSIPGSADVTLTTFDDRFDVMYTRLDINNVPELKEGRIKPRGMTKLYDAIGEAIYSVTDEHEYDGVIVLITTDGMENASTKYSADTIKELISSRKARGWKFIFSGTSEDAAFNARAVGINNTTVYADTGIGTRMSWNAHGVETTSYRTSVGYDEN